MIVTQPGGSRPAAGVEFEARLQSHLSSYKSKPGDTFQAVVTAPVRDAEGRILLPERAVVHGLVRKARRVGSGLVHERAALEIEFTGWSAGAAGTQTLRAELVALDNARESVVSRSGRIVGVLATDSAQVLMQGFWRLPSTNLFRRAISGLSGATNLIWSKVQFAPASVAGIFALRCLLFQWPEPEIHLSPGVDLKLRLVDHDPAPAGLWGNTPAAAAAASEEDRRVERLAALLPIATSRDSGKPTDDIVNLVFAGTLEEVEQAFLGAGWYPAERLTKRSMMRIYRAVTSMRGYPTQPVSTLHWNGRPPDITFQRSFNTVSKRHHVRLWKLSDSETYQGRPLWAAAATHDIGVRMDPLLLGMTHEIDPRIDRERDKIVSDLRFSGCLSDSGGRMIPRAIKPPFVTTDGGLAFVPVASGGCTAPDDSHRLAQVNAPGQPGNAATRLVRRMTLEARHSLIRGNMYYLGYRFIQEGVWKPLRGNGARRAMAAATMPPDAAAAAFAP